jgi:hypothetical protein
MLNVVKKQQWKQLVRVLVGKNIRHSSDCINAILKHKIAKNLCADLAVAGPEEKQQLEVAAMNRQTLSG